MLIGYARVSTDDQDTAAQVAALTAAGCARIFHEKASGGRWNRPQLLQLLTHLRHGDVVVVWKLDRLSRSLRDVLTLMAQLGDAGAGFRSVTEAIDTTTPAGRMLMHMVGAFAEFERTMLRERTQAGVEAARQERARGGPPPQALPAAASRDSQDGFGRREDGRRRSPLQGPPRHRLASARADFDPQDPCHIICKGSCQEDA